MFFKYLLTMLALIFFIFGCKKKPDPLACKSACENVAEVMAKSKIKQLSTLPNDIKARFIQKISKQKDKIISGCTDICKKDGNTSSAKCIISASNMKEVNKCIDKFTTQ